jgi:16S rRNA (uracil1498-N3)-methyltransferase
MHRFHLPPENWDSRRLSREETHHATHVLRMAPGDGIQVFDGAGRRAYARLGPIEAGCAGLEIESPTMSPQPQCALTLAQAVPKGKNMDLIVQKATELGVARIQPLLTRHTVVDLDAREAIRKREKWQSIALEACKQCGQDHLPTVERPRSVDEFLQQSADHELRVVASLRPGASSFHEVLSMCGRAPLSAVVAIGPEGDFSDLEIERLQAVGFEPVTLGPIVLRTETAAIYCLSVLAHELFIGD